MEKNLEEIKIWIEEDIEKFKPPTIYTDIEDIIHFQFWGWAIILLKNGKWFFEDTSGG